MRRTTTRTSASGDGSRRIRVLSLVAVAVLVALAGCGGGPGADTTTEAPTETDGTPTDTPASPTESQGTSTGAADGSPQSPTEAQAETTEPAAGTDTSTGTESAASTETDAGTRTDAATETEMVTETATPEEARAGDLPADAGLRHAETLREAGSFTTTTRVEYRNESGTVFTSDTVSRIDVDAERGYQNGTVSIEGFSRPAVTSTYTNGSATYQRTQVFGQTQYQRSTEPYGGGQAMPVNFSTVVGDVDRNYSEMDVRFDENGTTTVDGETVTRYDADSADLATLWDNSQFEEANVTASSMTVSVGDDGVFRQYEMTVDLLTSDGETVTLHVRQRFTDIGSTTVEEPDWLDEAREQTG